ncbi:ATP-binding protein [Streptomyces sp. NPDC059080]|uniref:ATP-binding protein n=1 Tax=Streptomyces sp. NPDC059080 TaxID=3346718 RepID=UPI0036D0F338
MTVTAHPRYAAELRVTAERVPQIRRIVAAHLRHWRLAAEIPAACRGLVELLDHVRRHVGPDAVCVVEVRWSGRHLTVSVADRGPRMAPLDSAQGGGLAAVAALSDSWGTCPTDDGKVVWFTRSVGAARETPLTAPRPSHSVPDAKPGPDAEADVREQETPAPV